MTSPDQFLNWLVKQCPPEVSGAANIELGTTKRVLAAQLATTSETLSRTFAKLRGEGLLEIRRATVHVPNTAALRARFRQLLGES